MTLLFSFFIHKVCSSCSLNIYVYFKIGIKYDQQKHSLPKYVMEAIKPVFEDLASSKLFLFIMIFTYLFMMFFQKKLYNVYLMDPAKMPMSHFTHSYSPWLLRTDIVVELLLIVCKRQSFSTDIIVHPIFFLLSSLSQFGCYDL